MKTKVQIIVSQHPETLELCINEFIKDKEVVDIKFTSALVIIPGRQTAISDRALIIYKEKEND